MCLVLVVLGRLRPDLFLRELARELRSPFCSSVRANETPEPTPCSIVAMLSLPLNID